MVGARLAGPPRRSGAGRLITAVLRRGGRAESSSAATVLCRAARMAGTNVATIATASATATTKPTVVPLRDGALGAPRRPAPGLSINGATSCPTSSPIPAAHRPTSTCSNRSTTATNRGVPPTAFGRPTRRVCSAMRPPTSTVTLATARRASSQLPVRRTFCTLAITCASPSRMLCQENRVGAVGEALAS